MEDDGALVSVDLLNTDGQRVVGERCWAVESVDFDAPVDR